MNDAESTGLRPRRLRVIGGSGVGKTTLAREVARRLGVAHLELDAVFWDRDWQFRDLAEARELVREFAAAHPEGWVMDGNWESRVGDALAEELAPDLRVWLDFPRWRVMPRIVRRTLRRGITGEELWHGNRERPATWFARNDKENIVLWAWRAVPRMRERHASDVGAPGFLRLGSPREARAWLASLGPKGPGRAPTPPVES